MKRTSTLRILLLTAVPILPSCDAPAPAPVMERDSAGIHIVENPATESPTWRLGPEVAAVGVAEGPPERQLFRVYAGAILEDGFVVANAGTSELRFYDEAGVFVEAVGRDGEGPGEFRELQAVWTFGDSLLAYDFTLGRVSVYGPDRAFARWIRPAPIDARVVFVMDAFADGSLLTMTSPVFDEAGATTGIVRMVLDVMRHDAQGERVVSFGRHPWSEAWRQVIGDDDFRMTSIPFAKTSGMAAGAGRMVFGDASSYSIAEYDDGGSLQRFIRLDREPAKVTDTELERFRSLQLQAAAEQGTAARMERMLEGMPTPDVVPAYERLRLDDEGRLWVQDYRLVRDDPVDWHIFDVDGHHRARLTVPPRFFLLDIRRGLALGHTTDDLGVERVSLLPIVTSN